jgi:hypothetical protein
VIQRGQTHELRPDVHVHPAQLGMLLLTSGQVDAARLAWSALDGLDN